MTFEEAKKILEKEGFNLDGPGKPHAVSVHFTEFEPLYIYEAMQVVSSAGYNIMIPVEAFDERKARLKEEYGKNHIKGDFSGNKSIGYSGEPIPGSPLSAVEGIKLKWKDNRNTSENPALKEAASQFNDALLDEQGKKIKRLGKKISRLNKIIHKKNLKIEEFRKESSRHLRGKIKMFGENMDLSQELCDKNEELRLTKIREKNLAELGLKYVGENEKLKKKLADKIVNEIDARALKSAESALAYKEKVITEKDEVIADLGKELAATKKELEEKTKLVEVVRKGSKEYCEYGIAAEKMIQKMAKVIVSDKPVSLKDFKEYRRLANGYSFNPQLFDFSEEEKKKLSLIRDDSVGAVTNQKNYSPFKDTHPTEDNPEEVELDEILEYVRKDLEEGHTVSIDYDKADEGGDHYAK